MVDSVSDDNAISQNEIHIGRYCGALYDAKWYVGIITDHDSENNDYKIRFMRHASTPYSQVWPKHDDICWVPRKRVLCMIEAPSTGSSGRVYSITNMCFQRITSGTSYFKPNT